MATLLNFPKDVCVYLDVTDRTAAVGKVVARLHKERYTYIFLFIKSSA